ncbi:MAG TPA: SLC13 family permease, partial [Candidatus Omnitrophota bacterium]|nr:SLC13 family permease [Candidatus Omnitrophota bacterium]
ATLIGDPPSMLLAGFAKMNFTDFFFYHGKPSIFFAVQIGTVVSFFILYAVFRSHRQKVELIEVEKVKSWIPTTILISLIILLAVSSFFDTGFSYAAGIICMFMGIISLLWERFVLKSSVKGILKSLDWETAFFLIGIFLLVGSLTANGWIEVIAKQLSLLIGQNILLGYLLIVLISVFVSAFVDNVPFLATMLPVVVSMSDKMQISPTLFLFGLLIGASVGGNITPIGASANIVACSLLKKEGYQVSFKEFVKIGLPFTLAAVSAATVFVWFIWKP